MRKKLVYFNLGGFGDTDITVLRHLNKVYDLTWFLLDEPLKNVNLTKEQATVYAKENKIKLIVCTRNFRQRSLKNLGFFSEIRHKINAIAPDYMFTCVTEWGWMLQVPFLHCKKIVYGIHDVKAHTYNKSLRLIVSRKLHDVIRNVYKHPCVFSKNQQDLYKQLYGKTIPNLGMSYKNFGKSNKTVGDINNGVKLLFFGSINAYKGLDLLIEAIEKLYIEGVHNISLTIAGKGNAWKDCEPLIKHKDLYNLQIRFVANEEVPDLFCSHHFLVLPYRDATQSGPLLTALYYNLPIIAPNFGCFSETYSPKSAILYNPNHIKEALKEVSNLSDNDYRNMLEECNQVHERYSEENIVKNYINCFKKL